MGIPPTHIDRTKPNAYIFRETNIIAYTCEIYELVLEKLEANPGAKMKVRTLINFLDEQAIKHMGHMLWDRNRDAVTSSTFNIDEIPNLPTKLRVRRPRLNLYKESSK
eukprot:5420334-Karenia_brevis.AAC.1